MKTKGIMALVVLLIILLAVNPMMVNNIYETILGRIVLIGVVIFLSMNNVALGLLVALTIIAASNQFGSFTKEGFDSASGVTIGEDNTAETGSIKVLTNSATKDKVKQRISDLKAKAQEAGVDKESIKTAIASKDSSTIPVDRNMLKSDEVSAHKESILSNSESSLTENFASNAAIIN
jgi:hypothetical protein